MRSFWTFMLYADSLVLLAVSIVAALGAFSMGRWGFGVLGIFCIHLFAFLTWRGLAMNIDRKGFLEFK